MANRFQTYNVAVSKSNTAFTHGLTLNGVGGAAGVRPTEYAIVARAQTNLHLNTVAGFPLFFFVTSSTTTITIKKRNSSGINTTNLMAPATGRIDLFASVPHTFVR